MHHSRSNVVAFTIKLLFMLQCFYNANARCYLSSEQIAGERSRILATVSRGRWSLLRHDYLERGDELHSICNGNEQQVIRCQNNDVLDTPFPTNVNCDNPVRESVVEIPSRSCPAMGGTMRAIGYQVFGQFLELYRTCHRDDIARTMYATHQVYYTDVALSRLYARGSFKTDGIIKGTVADSYRKDHVFPRFQELLGAQQDFVPNAVESIVERGHLVPAADFTTIDQMLATFHFINVMPQFGVINRGNWRKVEEWIRELGKRVDMHGPPVNVMTGTIDVLELPTDNFRNRVPMYLYAGNNRNDVAKVPMPKWLFKAVSSNGDCIVFVTLNDPKIPRSRLPEPICKPKSCPRGVDFEHTSETGFSYCCSGGSFRKTHPEFPICPE